MKLNQVLSSLKSAILYSAIIIAGTTHSQAHAQRHDQRHDRWGGGGQDHLQDDLEIQLRQTVSNEVLNLRQLLNLDMMSGRMVDRVEVIAGSAQFGGSLELLINRRSIAPAQQVSGYLQSYILRPGPNAVLGQVIRDLDLSVRGSANIDRIIVHLLSGFDNGGGGGGFDQPVHLEAPVRQVFRGQGTLPVLQIVGVRPDLHSGLSINMITLRASAQYGQGSASLLINGMRVGFSQTISSFMGEVMIQVPSGYIVGRNLRSLQVIINGNVAVDSVAVDLGGDQFDLGSPHQMGEGHRQIIRH